MSQKKEINPPWVEYGRVDPWWGGWRQGVSETWLLDEFLPFWRNLSADDRSAYLERWPPPDADWRTYLMVHWV